MRRRASEEEIDRFIEEHPTLKRIYDWCGDHPKLSWVYVAGVAILLGEVGLLLRQILTRVAP
jgi:hypothetical protein